MANYVKHSQRTLRRACEFCGSTDRYLAHDTDQPGKTCDECHVTGRIVVIDRDGTLHNCQGKPAAPEAFKPIPAPVPPPATPRPQAEANGNGGQTDRLKVLSELIDVLQPASIDADEVRKIVATEVAKINFPTRVEIKAPNGDLRKIEGATHKIVPTILTILGNARKHVLMVGPAGTGKSTIAEQCAEALGVPYYSVSLSPQTPSSALLGYMQAAGEYVRSLYREAYEHGGVFHFDEFDNAHPSVLAVINASLANGHMAFPDQMVKRHPDFRCCASANTYGTGPDRQYVGRQALDAATLDRFAVVPVGVDEALEQQICESTGAETRIVTQVLAYVRALRKNAERHKMALMFSPRASEGMCALMTAGINRDDAIAYRVRKGISDADWSKVNSGVPLPTI